jgi:hypothetical protein
MSHKNPDPSRLTPVDASKTVAANLKGVDVISPSGDILGMLADFLVSGSGHIDAVVIEMGGLLGLGTRRVAIEMDTLDLLVDPYEKFYLRVSKSASDLEGAPDVEGEPSSAVGDKSASS